MAPSRPITQRQSGPAYTPPPPSFSQSASINVPRVSPAPNVAGQLLNVLGLAGDIMQNQRAEEAQQAVMLTKQQDEYFKSHGKTDTEARLAIDEHELQNGYTDADGNKVNGLADYATAHDVQGAQRFIQSELQRRWQGASGLQGEYVQERYRKLIAEGTGQVYEQLRSDIAREDAAKISTVVDANLQKGEFNFERDLASPARGLFGKDADDQVYSQLLLFHERNPGNTAIFDIPERYADGTPSILTTKYGPQIQQMKNEAESHKTQAEKNALAATEATATMTLERRIDAGLYPSDRELNAHGDRFGWSAEQREGLMRKRDAEAQRRAKEAADTVQLTTDFANGRGAQLLHASDKVSPEKIRDAFDGYVTQGLQHIAPDQQLGYVIQTSINNGLIYRPVVDKLATPNTANPQAFNEQLAIWDQLNASGIANAAGYFVPSDDARRVYATASVLRQAGKDPVTIMQAAANAGAKRTDAEREVSGQLYRHTLKQLDKVQLVPGFFGGTKLSGVSNDHAVRAVAGQLAKAYADSGLLSSPEEIIKAVSSDLSTRSMVVNDTWYPMSRTTPVNAEQQLNYWMAVELPKVSAVSKDEVTIIPDHVTGADLNSYAVVHKGTIEPVIGKDGQPVRIDVAVLSHQFTEYKQRGPAREANARWSATPINPADAPAALDKYMQDRSLLSPAMRKQLDPLFVDATKARIDSLTASSKSHDWTQSATPEAQQKAATQKKAKAEHTRQFLNLITN